ncbi:hypothetical protein M409DRAFT_53916 [Zasmidium cellare ATCC 36951]|uniref:Uncharacterized protein n=1 Tax=Zasmidium cellare ATCC 36951 TaxID=1080233 RepID=A0A6A6CQD2_ZASCE|nr:uncharacterized protein M409DRAFT_53916 [Zasmidium cellare ATCC 36951]KAF2167979.1 hypothetical protein M409DRAFT_53916 [Zasmidium cellare ATCC 36951]
MCIAGLHVTTAPCSHRWYELIRPCDPSSNLANCTEKLKLQGWENRLENCPFCDGAGNHHHSTHRLFGSTSSASSVSSSPTISEMGMTPVISNRRGSCGTINNAIGLPSMSPLSRQSSGCSIEVDRSQRAKDMNDRINIYLSSDPHEVLPSAKKNYPTYAAAIARIESSSQESSSTNTSLFLKRRGSFSRGWKRMSGRFNSSLFKIV